MARGLPRPLRLGNPELHGQIVVKPIDDPEWWGYWHAYFGELRINGGLCNDYTEGAGRARRAIEQHRSEVLWRDYYWDVETQEWYKKGTLPPV
jgi:hypothetical protein